MGHCGTIGMGGLTLGGGYGPLNGTCGPAADNLLGAETVLAGGRRVTTGPDAEPDLCWALRGKGDWKSWWNRIGAATRVKVEKNERTGRPLH